MDTSDFEYDLPRGLIAQHPLTQRPASRMLVLDRGAARVAHEHVADLAKFLKPGDLLVLNDTRVIPARIRATKESTGGGVELLFLEDRGDGTWEALLRASRRPPVGSILVIGRGDARAELVQDGERGRCILRIRSPRSLLDVLEEEGAPPLPPYIQREEGCQASAHDRERYQTVFASTPGAVAAPTAGLHFTHELLQDLATQGIAHVRLTLHVGIGTFRPVTADRVEDHRMEAERYAVSAETAEAVNCTRAAGGRVVAVGSTSVRTLETVADDRGRVHPGSGRTALFIVPPYRFQVVDALLTNFHLPCSTLLMMVSALAGKDRVLDAYREAVAEQYRFFSYGDCMLIV
jgi:S-adenosylmethionine:tRNA ribosyltransferase-isomerase